MTEVSNWCERSLSCVALRTRRGRVEADAAAPVPALVVSAGTMAPGSSTLINSVAYSHVTACSFSAWTRALMQSGQGCGLVSTSMVDQSL